MYKYRCITQITTWPQCGGNLYHLIVNCFLLFSSDLAYISVYSGWYSKTQIESQHRVRHPVSRVTYSSCPLYYFTLLYYALKCIIISENYVKINLFCSIQFCRLSGNLVKLRNWSIDLCCCLPDIFIALLSLTLRVKFCLQSY